MNLSEYAAKWEEQILSMKKPATIASSRSHVRKLDEALGPRQLSEITEGLVQQHISLISKGLSPRATRNYWGTVRLILSRAKKEGLIQSVPEPVLPKGGGGPQPYLNLEQMKKLSRCGALYFLLSETGLRIGEALGLKTGDVDFQNLTLTVNRSNFNGKDQEPKTENAFRTISISPKLGERLRTLPSIAGHNYIFATRTGTPLRQTQLLRKLQDGSVSIGGNPVGFHAFRRGNATLCAKLGMPVKMLSYRHGRRTGDLTVDSYICYEKLEDRDYAEKLGELLSH
jgi:integrase